MLAPMEIGSTIVGGMSVSDLILGLSQGFLAVWISVRLAAYIRPKDCLPGVSKGCAIILG